MNSVPTPGRLRSVLYTYSARFNAIPIGQSQVQSITTDNDADFEAMLGTFYAYEDPGGNPANQTDNNRLIPTATVELTTQDTFRVQNIAVPIGALFGHGSSPMVWPASRVFGRRTVITFNVANLSGAPLTLWLALVGRKLYTPQ